MIAASPAASDIPLRLGDFKTLTDALDYAATGKTGINFYAANGTLKSVLTYADLRSQSIQMARRLSQLAPKGALIGLLAQTSEHFVRIFFACQYAGLVPVPMPVPTTMGGKDVYLNQIKQMCETAKVSALFAPTRLMDMLAERLKRSIRHYWTCLISIACQHRRANCANMARKIFVIFNTLREAPMIQKVLSDRKPP